jgi:hypothetical protein
VTLIGAVSVSSARQLTLIEPGPVNLSLAAAADDLQLAYMRPGSSCLPSGYRGHFS